MQWHRSGLIAMWEFSEEHIEKLNGSENSVLGNPMVEKHCEKRWGAMVVIKSLQFLPTAINAALKEATHSLNTDSDREFMLNGLPGHASQGNMLHVALVGINNQMSSLQDRYASLSFSLSSSNYHKSKGLKNSIFCLLHYCVFACLSSNLIVCICYLNISKDDT